VLWKRPTSWGKRRPTVLPSRNCVGRSCPRAREALDRRGGAAFAGLPEGEPAAYISGPRWIWRVDGAGHFCRASLATTGF
jgi:hypothetical protein